MLDTIFTVGEALSTLVLIVGAYLVLVEASGTTASPEEDKRLHLDGPDY